MLVLRPSLPECLVVFTALALTSAAQADATESVENPTGVESSRSSVIAERAVASEHPAESARRGYSFLSLGFSLVDYEESTAISINGRSVDIETDVGEVPTQGSGAYVAIDHHRGFYLQSQTTLGVPRSSETWEIDDVVVRRNRVAFEQQQIALIGTLRRSDTDHWLLGASYEQFEFNRFDGALTSDSDRFGLDESSLEQGAVSEVVTDVVLQAGWERNQLFQDTGVGWRYQLQLMLSVPAYTSVVNTSIEQGKTFDRAFSGVGVFSSATIGYQFNPNVFAGLRVVGSVLRRGSVDRGLDQTSGRTGFPATTVVFFYPALGVYWSF